MKNIGEFLPKRYDQFTSVLGDGLRNMLNENDNNNLNAVHLGHLYLKKKAV